MVRYLVEFIGTFFLVSTVGYAVIEPGAGALAPLTDCKRSFFDHIFVSI
jgi:hypothetical protein